MINRKALVIGINKYSYGELNCCINDANEISKLLQRNHDGTVNFDVKEKHDVDSKELKKLCKDLFSSDPDVSLFYFSGHGYSSDDEGYLVTTDYDGDTIGLNMNELFDIASKSKAKNKVIIVDACHSGRIGQNPFNTYVSNITDGMTIMTSSRRNEFSLEYGRHGLFTSLLIDAMSGGASDLLGNITAGGIYSYIDRCLGPWDQRPVFKTNISSFVPILKAKPLIELDQLKLIAEYFTGPDTEIKLDPSFEFTNTPDYQHAIKEPYAVDNNVNKFKTLQLFTSLGLVRPVGAEHMYYAAMNSKSCILTNKGKYYLKLIKEERI